MQIKRNETLYGTLNEALNGFGNGDVSAVTDGDIVVSRYNGGSILGVVNIKQDEKHYWTLYPSVDRIQYVSNEYTICRALKITETKYGTDVKIPIGYYVNSNMSKVEVSARAVQHSGDFVLYSFWKDKVGATCQYFGSISYLGWNWRPNSSTEYGADRTLSFSGGNIHVIADFTAKTFNMNTFSSTPAQSPTMPSGGDEVNIFNHVVANAAKGVENGDMLYSYKIWEGDTLVVDLVPAIRNVDQQAGLYDRVRDMFFSTEAFTYECINYSLPNVEFELNYNAKLYDSTTHSIPNHEDAHTEVDMVFQSGYYPTYTEGSDHITWPTLQNGPALGSSVNPNFNRTSSAPNLTIIAKALTTTSGAQALFVNRGTNYNWMFRWYKTRLTLHGTSETGQIAVSDSEPNIAWARVNSSVQVDYGNYTQQTTVQPVAFTYGSQNNLGPAFFRGYSNQNAEIWGGDFYWIYMTKNTLTNEQIQQVIEYNEGL